MAPEVIKGIEYDCRVDMWAVGVITYMMLCGFPPFEGDDEATVTANSQRFNYSFPSPEWDRVSDEAKSFVKACLTGISDRTTASEAIKHPWILKYAGNSKEQEKKGKRS